MTQPTRRTFLKGSIIGLTGIMLGACSPPRIDLPVAAVSSPATTPLVPASTPPRATAKATRAAPNAAPTRQNMPPLQPAAAASGLPVIAGRPTDRSVAISCQPSAATTISYDYGAAPGEYSAHSAPQAAGAGMPLETVIAGLQPGARYYVRPRSGDAVMPEFRFTTQRPPGAAFTFCIQGDSHPERVGKQFDAGLYRRTLLSAAADQPDFYMTIGDDFSVDQLKSVTADTVTALYAAQRQYLSLVGAPVFLVNGNHEQAALANLRGAPAARDVAIWAQTARNATFPQPAPDGFYSGDTELVDPIGLLRDYYAFTWGDALLVVLDLYWHSLQTVDNAFGVDRDVKGKRDLWNNTLGDAQYQWFKQTLQNSRAKFKFVFTHHINGTGRGGVEIAHTYEWGDAAQLAAHRPGWDRTIHQLMADHGVTIFFQGHDHIFAHQELDGVVYQTLPEPANPNPAALENADAYLSGDVLPNSGHVRVTVAPDGVTVDYIRSYLDKPDEVAFTYHK